MMSEFYSTIYSRRSVRRYTDQAVPTDLIERLIDAATWAPSAHNRQPWRFVAMTTAATRERLARSMGEQLRQDLARDGMSAEQIEKDAARSYSRISNSPALILVCITMEEMDRYPDERRSRNEQVMAIQSAAMAVENLLFAAHAEGLGACWMCAPLFCPDVVRSTLDLPVDWEPQALITVGYPAEVKHSTRQPLSSRMVWR